MSLPVLALTGVEVYDYFFTLGLLPLFPVLLIAGAVAVVGHANNGY